ncbi:histidine kinase [bacterium]|nr:histidine kinase [bacterium]
MRFRIRDVLIVSSLYDFHVFEEDGRIYELLRSEYQGLNLSHTPELTHISSGHEALRLICDNTQYDLIITTLHIGDMTPGEFVRMLRKSKIDTPIIMLAFDNRELADMIAHGEDKYYDQVFIWQGNYRLILAIIKFLEDHINVAHDTEVLGVQSIILVEDNIRHYSTLLPLIYIEIINQTHRLIREGVNQSHKNLRQRARPKILLCTTYEEAVAVYTRYHATVLGIISDVEFSRNGVPDREAGFLLAGEVREKHRDIPILFQSSVSENRTRAREMGCSFTGKDSDDLAKTLREFMRTSLGFGDFVFRTPDGKTIDTAQDLHSMEKKLKHVPLESIKFHAERNHFSNWLKARTEFWLANKLRPRRTSDFDSVQDLRDYLIESLKNYRRIQQRGRITDFNPELFDPSYSLSRYGGGSLGGKARGLGFINTLIHNYGITKKYPGVRIHVPAALIIATDVFDEFMDMNGLRAFVLQHEDNSEIDEAFRSADRYPPGLITALKDFLKIVSRPLAVRSSGLLEDSHVHPFAGVYETFMLPNNHPDPDVRLSQLLERIKGVYASAFYRVSKDYMKATTFRLEEEKMAVIVQLLTGSERNGKFYPIVSGTANSYNFYPVYPQESKDGIASIALGLGTTVVDGGRTVRFSPAYPHHLLQFSSPKMALENSQHDFVALSMTNDTTDELHLTRSYPVAEAEKDDVLHFVASTYSPENDAVYDGISRSGPRIISFANILKNDIFPLAEIIRELLSIGTRSMGTPVDIEFAADLGGPRDKPRPFSLLQIRPMVLSRESEKIHITPAEKKRIICRSEQVLGNGVINTLEDIVLVDRETYERSRSIEVAGEVSRFNAALLEQKRHYLLIGVGRWGSMDPWLGIPVRWSMISGARVIVEAGFRDFEVEPSQGTHFLENLNSFSIGYFTLDNRDEHAFLDWEWLNALPAIERKTYTRHIRLDRPLSIRMSGRQRQGVILRPKE